MVKREFILYGICFCVFLRFYTVKLSDQLISLSPPVNLCIPYVCGEQIISHYSYEISNSALALYVIATYMQIIKSLGF